MNNGTREYRHVGVCEACDRQVWTRIETSRNAMNGHSQDRRAYCLNCGDPVPVYPVANGEAAEQLGIQRADNAPEREVVCDD
jgi:transcriptional regulator NrdR family protein